MKNCLTLLLLALVLEATSQASAQLELRSDHADKFRDHHVPATTAITPRPSLLRSRQLKEMQVVGAEDFCDTHPPTDHERLLMAQTHHKWQQEHQGRRILQEVSIQIPVHMHMLLKQDAVVLTNQQIRKFVNTLNGAFASSPFEFVLYGTDITYNDSYAECREEAAFKKATRSLIEQDGTDVLHLWICDTNAVSKGSAGYSYFPPVTQSSSSDLDGVVIMTPNTHIFDPSAVYYALVHEVGHWLGLLHTFEGGCSVDKRANWGAYDAFNVMGDGVKDTPAHSGPTYAQSQGMETCWQNLEPKLNTCPDTLESIQAGMDAGDDPIGNFMNYIPPNCYRDYGRFTPGQVERMVSQYEAFRRTKTVRSPPAYVSVTQVSTSAARESDITMSKCARSRKSPCSSHSDCCGRQRCLNRSNRHGVSRSTCQSCRKSGRGCESNGECCNGLTCRQSVCQVVAK
ncbi:hypothetical protein MPSEU_000771400 [Mayamaea pseudoterrestris]|nr:hypothetical protein MPSEU_000771400 [Mayamaea pseudoterrestris]